jgi:hypothetical protein
MLDVNVITTNLEHNLMENGPCYILEHKCPNIKVVEEAN